MASINSPLDAPLDAMGSQQPRIRVAPEYVSSAGGEAIECAALAGLDLDPWEQLVLVDALGERSNGKWAAFEVGTEVPRQNGKNAQHLRHNQHECARQHPPDDGPGAGLRKIGSRIGHLFFLIQR